MEIGRNIVHGSDSPESGIREAAIFFAAHELADWDRDLQNWISE
jgi:nucleoside-diphosphate kinase